MCYLESGYWKEVWQSAQHRGLCMGTIHWCNCDMPHGTTVLWPWGEWSTENIHTHKNSCEVFNPSGENKSDLRWIYFFPLPFYANKYPYFPYGYYSLLWFIVIYIRYQGKERLYLSFCLNTDFGISAPFEHRLFTSWICLCKHFYSPHRPLLELLHQFVVCF